MASRARLAVDIESAGVIAILRGVQLGQVGSLVDALCRGGIVVVEVTLNTPGALHLISQVAESHRGRVLLGAGTVIDAAGAFAAVAAGADFLVTPVFSAEVIGTGCRYGKPVVSGALTPTEALAACELGADFVKVFPAGPLGPAYISQMRAPLPQIPLVAVGGVTAGNAADFVRAGAAAVGVGGSLVDAVAAARGDWDCIADRAVALVAAVAMGRRPRE